MKNCRRRLRDDYGTKCNRRSGTIGQDRRRGLRNGTQTIGPEPSKRGANRAKVRAETRQRQGRRYGLRYGWKCARGCRPTHGRKRGWRCEPTCRPKCGCRDGRIGDGGQFPRIRSGSYNGGSSSVGPKSGPKRPCPRPECPGQAPETPAASPRPMDCTRRSKSRSGTSERSRVRER